MDRCPAPLSLVACLGALAAALQAQPQEAAIDEAGFEARIRPLLIRHCGECHGDGDLEADFLAVTPGGLRAGSHAGPVLVPGNPEGSRLLQVVGYASDVRMPPAGKLPGDELELLEAWVAAGAPMPEGEAREGHGGLDWEERLEHWLWQPLSGAELPAEEASADWATDPLDRFVFQGLRDSGLMPSSEATRRAWLRRVTYALSGVPPTLAELQAFEADQEPGAHGRVADRLLASPRFAETWSRHWLDLVRYAETKGHEFDFAIPNPWQYRDYVLRAVEADLPFDRFLMEHVAGDLLPDPRRDAEGRNESVLGTGFWWFGDEVHSPVDPRKDETDRLSNQVEVFGKAFLGLTVSCARCHDHKFDAISQADYYALCGYLLSSTYRQVRFETDAAHAELRQSLDVLGEQHEPLAREELAQLLRSELDGAGQAIAAARWAVELVPFVQAKPDPLADRMLEDFERESWAPWTVEGEAFGEGPYVVADAPGHMGPLGAFGSRCVNTYATHESDRQTGTLTSPPFRIAAPYLHFLVGGGDLEGLAVECLVAGEVVRTARGKQANLLEPVVWDLQEFVGGELVLRIVDHSSEGWGQIGADRFVWSYQPRPEDLLLETELDGRRAAALDQAARERGLTPDEVGLWRAWLESAARRRQGSDFRTPTGRVWFDGRRDGHEAGWIQDGVAFQSTPTGQVMASPGREDLPPRLEPAGALVADSIQRDLELAPGTMRDPGSRNWVQSGRTLYLDRRELGTGRLAYLVRGRGHAFVQLDSHRMLSGPLHGSSIRRFDTQGSWRWVLHNLGRYSGVRAQLELTPVREEDQPLAIAMVVELAAGEALPKGPLASPNPLDGLGEGYVEFHLDELRSELEGFLAGESLMEWPNTWLAAIAARRELPKTLAWRGADTELRAGVSYVSATAPSLLDTAGVDEYLLARGASNAPLDPVPRRFLTALQGSSAREAADVRSPASQADEGGSDRLQLARSLVDPANPVTARVAVNRVWHHLFGRGLVPSVDDFGVMGEEPSHPELLDHLARRFQAGGWSRKALIRDIVLSASYRQSSLTSAETRQRDPERELLSHAPVRRLTAEALRDGILFAAGSLNEERFGPSVRVHLTESLSGRGRPGSSGPLDGDGRRSVYLETRRNFLQPLLLVFDAPVPATTIGRRAVSNVPAQALALLNDPFVIEQAERLGASLMELDSTARLDELYGRTLTRAPRADERAAAEAYLADSKVESEAWSELAHVLFNTKEFRYLD